mmetsp:Transcript_66291/g.91771  ORF Transcript_66291/g.91771 Transcript_66291/m.91771 type:complete len:274 (-) Transcript_66291:147-968(-)
MLCALTPDPALGADRAHAQCRACPGLRVGVGHVRRARNAVHLAAAEGLVLLVALQTAIVAALRLAAVLANVSAAVVARCPVAQGLALPRLAVPVRGVGATRRACLPALGVASRDLRVALVVGRVAALRGVAVAQAACALAALDLCLERRQVGGLLQLLLLLLQLLELLLHVPSLLINALARVGLPVSEDAHVLVVAVHFAQDHEVLEPAHSLALQLMHGKDAQGYAAGEGSHGQAQCFLPSGQGRQGRPAVVDRKHRPRVIAEDCGHDEAILL